MKISRKYQLPAEKLDFININLAKDNKIFIETVKIKNGTSESHKTCYKKIDSFIQILLELSRKREYKKLLEIIDNFHERNETRLGYSLESTYGKSFGENGGRDLVKLLAKNEMVSNGEVEDIFDCLIMVPNIGEDKVSDLITTIIFLDLIKLLRSCPPEKRQRMCIFQIIMRTKQKRKKNEAADPLLIILLPGAYRFPRTPRAGSCCHEREHRRAGLPDGPVHH